MNDSMVVSHRTLRFFLGGLGLLLPPVLIGGGYLAGDGVLRTLSSYYHSESPILRGFFVGVVFSVGAFLFCYKGHQKMRWGFLGDNQTANIAGIGAIFIAIFPTTTPKQCAPTSCAERAFSMVHDISTLVFLLASAAMVLLLFTMTKDDPPPCPGKRARNCIYRICGGVMLAGTVVLAIVTAVEHLGGEIDIPHKLLIPESVVILAFGAAWLVKAIRPWSQGCRNMAHGSSEVVPC